MNPIRVLFKYLSTQSRNKRAEMFKSLFILNEDIKILDLGSENGSNIHSVLRGTKIKSNNVYIADIKRDAVEQGSAAYGYIPVTINESGKLPFDDKYFDIVFCSSVIEHVTIPKDEVWALYSGKLFKNRSIVRQSEFAEEIRRLGKQYFVQTPYKYFPIESHSWLPFIAWLPRFLILPTLKFTNIFWVKKTSPDWYLLNKKEMLTLFNDSKILDEVKFGLIKSIMAVKSDKTSL